MKRKPYVKNLMYKIFYQFGKKYLTVDYDRSGENNHITYSNVPKWVKDETTVRKYINS